MRNQSEHKQAILDQFTKQAEPFQKKLEHADAAVFQLYLDATGVTSQDTVLDVACGPGLVACAFAVVARQVTGIDLTPAMIEQAKKLQEKKGLTNMTWQLGDVLSLPFAEASFSLVVTRYSFHHLLDPQVVLQEMVRVCTPGGTVMVVDVVLPPDKVDAYNRMEKLRDNSHTRALTLDQFLDMARTCGLRDIVPHFYRLEMELEAQLKASFPRPGDADKIRQMVREDIGQDRLGVGAHLRGGEIHLTYPNLILVAKKI
jgi:ubiquinone/menaquinone biosynthesis C-methylase UbiE